MEFLATDPRFPRFIALLFAFLLVVRALRMEPEWLLVVLPLFALTFLGFDRLAEGTEQLLASGDTAQLAIGAALMALPALGVGFALGRRTRRPQPAQVVYQEPVYAQAPTPAEPAAAPYTTSAAEPVGTTISSAPQTTDAVTETTVIRPDSSSRH